MSEFSVFFHTLYHSQTHDINKHTISQTHAQKRTPSLLGAELLLDLEFLYWCKWLHEDTHKILHGSFKMKQVTFFKNNCWPRRSYVTSEAKMETLNPHNTKTQNAHSLFNFFWMKNLYIKVTQQILLHWLCHSKCL